jgi:hypothetical protein
VKRRIKTGPLPPPELVEFDVEAWAPAECCADDPWRPTWAHQQWRAARAAWVAAGGIWPSDEDQREFEEAFATPDEPFCGNTDEHHCLGADCLDDRPTRRNQGYGGSI